MINYSDATRKILAVANSEAQRCNHEFIGTEHLLLALMKTKDCFSVEFGERLGLDYKNVQTELLKRIRTGPDMVTMGKLPYTPRTKMVLEYAHIFAKERKGDIVTPYDVFYALLREGDGKEFKDRGIADQVLTNMSITEERVKQNVLELYVEGNNSAAELQTGKTITDYWPVPKSRMSLTEYLHFAGGFKRSEKDNRVIELRGANVDELVVTHELKSDGAEEITLIYNPKSPKQIEESLRARELLDMARVKYREIPDREQAAKELQIEVGRLKEQVNSREGLVNLLQQK